MFYNLRNNYWLRNADTTEARYGLLTTDFRRKPAFHAFRTAARRAARTARVSRRAGVRRGRGQRPSRRAKRAGTVRARILRSSQTLQFSM
jgi:hypothetical protein